MPTLGATDPTDLQAHTHAQLGPSQKLEQTHHEMPHPCRGGGGYDIWFHEEQLAKAQAGPREGDLPPPGVQDGGGAKADTGHCQPVARTGLPVARGWHKGWHQGVGGGQQQHNDKQ
jgi:hypothetical protein